MTVLHVSTLKNKYQCKNGVKIICIQIKISIQTVFLSKKQTQYSDQYKKIKDGKS